jgi:uncharacterized phage protein (TIGR02220 family)
LNYYQFHIGDYAVHTRHLSLLEDLAYRRLIDWYYTNEKPIPPDPEKAARLIGMQDHAKEVSNILSDFFLKSDAGYINKRCDKEISKYKEKADRAKNANSHRWKSETDLKSDTKSDADQLPTNNQEPVTNNQIKDLSGEPDPDPHADSKPKNAELKAQASEILQFLNSKTGRNYQAVNGTLKPLMARLREGFTVTQCRQVIAKKARDWAANEKMEPYLRPKTLFAQENFSNYVGELEVIDEQVLS